MEILCEWVQLSEAAKENEYYQLQFQIEEMKFMCRMKECEQLIVLFSYIYEEESLTNVYI